MTEQREPSSRLWVSSRWHLLLLVAIPSVPFVWWLGYSSTEADSTPRVVFFLASMVIAVWWLPLAVHYGSFLRSARVLLLGDELIVRRWGKTKIWAVDDELRLRGAGRIWGASMLSGYSRGALQFNLLVGVVEMVFGALNRECFELYRECDGRSGERVFFVIPARFKAEGEPFQPGMRVLRAKLADLRAERKTAQLAAKQCELSELEQAQQDARAAAAELAERTRVSRNPIKRLRKLRKSRD